MLLWLTIACTNDPAPELAWISPAAGQTGVPQDLPVRVGVGGRWPDDYPLGGSISVWDGTGAPIAGEIDSSGDHLFFLPDAPWSNDTAYVWRWHFADPAPHGPTSPPGAPSDAPPDTYTFTVGGAIAVLGVALAQDDTPCVVTSAPAGTVPFQRLRVGDEPIEIFDTFRRDEGGATEPYPAGDPGVDVICFLTAASLTDRVDEPVLVGFGARSWTGPLGSDIEDLVSEVRRFAAYEEPAP